MRRIGRAKADNHPRFSNLGGLAESGARWPKCAVKELEAHPGPLARDAACRPENFSSIGYVWAPSAS